jgi:tetratricopeptide (TPR) repeat protein
MSEALPPPDARTAYDCRIGRVAELVVASYDADLRGEIARALAHAEDAAATARVAGSDPDRAAALAQLAQVYWRLGRYDEGKAAAAEAVARSGPRSIAEITAEIALGLCAAETDDLTGAEAHFRRAADLSRQRGNRRGLRTSLHNLASHIYHPRGQYALALAAFEESRRIDLDAGALDFYPLVAMVGLAYLMADRARAHALLPEAKRRVPPGALFEAFLLTSEAGLALDEDDLATARTLLERARRRPGEGWRRSDCGS